MAEEVIRLESVAFSNQSYQVLRDVNLSIKKNTYTVFLGRSGAGKTTLLKLMAGLLFPDEGKVEVLGRDINKEHDILDIKQSTGFVFQDAALLSNLTIKENLLLPLNFYYKDMSAEEKEGRVMELLEKVNLTGELDFRPAQLSMGEAKLISLCRALIAEPDILFLDEPLSSIDASLAKKLLRLINEYSDRENTTLIAVSYYLPMIREVADHLVLLEEGTISFVKSREQLLEMSPADRPGLLNDILA